MAAMIRDKIIESHFTSYLIESGELGVIEIKITEKFAGKAVSELNIPGEFLIATILKKKGIVIPQPDTRLEKNDILMGVVKTISLKKIRDFFGL